VLQWALSMMDNDRERAHGPDPGIDRVIAELADRQQGVIEHDQLRQLGIGTGAIRARLLRGSLYSRHLGVYSVGRRTLDQRGEWMAAVLACGPEALLSHWDAAALHRLLEKLRSEVHVIGRRSRHHRPGIVVHRPRSIHPEDRTLHDGIPVTSVARTLVDLAAVARPRIVERAFDEAERLGVLDLEELTALYRRSRGRRGLGAIRRLIASHVPSAGTDSQLEVLFQKLCQEEGFPRPLTNVDVAGLIVDAYWPDCELIVELDGYEYHRTRAAFERDRARDAALRLAGKEVVRLTYSQLTANRGWVATTLRRLRAQRLALVGSLSAR
jgi:very-short-patch-repair endonuclease